MNFNPLKYFSFIIVYRWNSILCLTSSHIPNLLLPCYNGSLVMDEIPLTVPLLIELLRKIELYDKTTMNLRILTTSLLHQAIFDGVLESDSRINDNGALPFRARGHEFYKYKLVADYFVSGESTLFLNESLSQLEICYLHNILSTSTIKAYRGDEAVTCTYNRPNMPVSNMELGPENIGRSDCPLMKGNLITRWGSITPGHLVYGSSAVLQNTQIPFANIIHAINKTSMKADRNLANSLWISTIAGDLAEAVLNQADRNIKLGTIGFWNDSLLPTAYYLTDHISDMTETMLLGGIDGLIIAYNIEAWEKILMRTRFSQIIDMYYSRRGIAYNSSFKASNRNEVFNDILKKTNLTQQIIGTANLLKNIGVYDSLLSTEDIEELATFVSDKFEDLADEITKRYDSLDHVNEVFLRSDMEIIIILDGSLDFHTTKKFVYSLAESAHISIYGSKLGLINGETGEWLANVTGEILTLFRDMQKAENSWPASLSLHLSFETIMAHYQNITKNNCTGNISRPAGRVIVVLSNKARPTDPDIYKSKEALVSIYSVLPETNIIYILSSNTEESFANVRNSPLNETNLSFSNDILKLSTSITNKLYDIPGQIVNIYCDDINSRMEDYLTPEQERFYEIYQEYTRRYNFVIKFEGYGYGDIFICANYQSAIMNETCRRITVNDEVTFNSKDLCPGDSTCNLQFILKANNSKFQCAENDCRYPDQLRLGITWTKSGSGAFSMKTTYLIFIFFLTCFNGFT